MCTHICIFLGVGTNAIVAPARRRPQHNIPIPITMGAAAAAAAAAKAKKNVDVIWLRGLCQREIYCFPKLHFLLLFRTYTPTHMARQSPPHPVHSSGAAHTFYLKGTVHKRIYIYGAFLFQHLCNFLRRNGDGTTKLIQKTVL